jgi:hypothetical protein
MVATTQAYVNWGRWVADCPKIGCTSAQQLRGSEPPDPEQYDLLVSATENVSKWKRDAIFYCTNCGMLASLQWPEPAIEKAIFQELLRRPAVSNRNWYPKGHSFATAHGLRQGQTVAELKRETEDNINDATPPINFSVHHGPYLDLDELRSRLL